MLPIRKGDGTGLSLPGYSEVRKGDGTVLSSAGPDIPDSEDLHARYDSTQLSLSDTDSVTTWPDETAGGHDLTPGSAPTYIEDGVNGKPVVRFDGVGEYLSTSFASLSQPNHIFIVARQRSVDDNTSEYWFDSADTNDRHAFFQTSNEWRLFAGTILSDTGADTEAHQFSALYDSTDSVFRQDQNEIASGDVGTQALNGFTLGSRASQDGNFAPIDVGEVLIYLGDKTGIIADIESYLFDKWFSTSGWESLSDTPTARKAPGVATDGGQIYAIGGRLDGDELDANEVYDPTSESWDTSVSDMPTPRVYYPLIEQDGGFYAVGGYNGTERGGEIEFYDPDTDSWDGAENFTDMPTPMSGHAGASDGTYLYTFGGTDSSGSPQADVQRYDPDADSWDTTLTDLPEPGDGIRSVYDGEYLWVVAGGDSNDDAYKRLSRYDIAADSWNTSFSEMPDFHNRSAVDYNDGYIYVVAGSDDTDSDVDTAHRYDISADEWESLEDVLTPRRYIRGRFADGSFYIPGGEVSGQDSDVFERYNP